MKFFIIKWLVWLKCNNLWSRYEFFCSCYNKKKDILILGKGPTQGLKLTLTAEKVYSINFTVTKIKFA